MAQFAAWSTKKNKHFHNAEMSFSSKNGYLVSEVVVRVILYFIFLVTEYAEPFRRRIQPEELWLYKYPKTVSYVPTGYLMLLVMLSPLFVFTVVTIFVREKSDFLQAGLGFSLSIGINGTITNFVKIVVGRPRPDFFWRCFPDGKYDADMQCTGLPHDVRDGLKSFPSGHSSFAFASLGLVAFYLAGKLQCFSARGRGESWRLCLAMVPLTLALAVALSRTCDYHHHWQDVLVGSSIGLVVAYLCYRQYFPGLSSSQSDHSYTSIAKQDFAVHSTSNELVTVKSV